VALFVKNENIVVETYLGIIGLEKFPQIISFKLAGLLVFVGLNGAEAICWSNT